MATAQVTYVATGSVDTWAFSFTYLDEDHVKLYLDGVEDTGATFPTASSIQASGGNPVVDTVVLIARETPRTALLTTISNSGSIRNSDINNQSLQALYAAEEARDQLDGTMSISADETYWDAQVSAVNKLISNVVDPVGAQDAATKNYVDTAGTSAAAAALASAAAALVSENNAATSESNADSAKTAAEAAQTAAELAETNVAADLVLTNADVVLTNADVVSTNADVVTTNADVVLTAADVVSADAAKTAAEAAQTAAELAADNFDDSYLGAKASDPTLDNDGDALTAGDLYFNTTTDQMKVYDGAAWNIAAISSTGVKLISANRNNILVNGDMHIGLENGVSSGTASLFHGADQWFTQHSQDGTLTTQLSTTPSPQGGDRYTVTVTTGDASIAAGQFALVVQNVEGVRIRDLLWGTANAIDTVVSFGFKGPAGTYALAIRNGAADRSYIREFTISGGEADTDTVQTMTVPGDTSGTWPTDTTHGATLSIGLAVGSTYHTTADAWQAGNFLGTSSTSNGIETSTDVFEVFDIRWHADPDSTGVAPPFELQAYSEAQKECQRYWNTIYITSRFTSGGASESGEHTVSFTQRMRVAPTATEITAGTKVNHTSTTLFPVTNSSRVAHVAAASGDSYDIGSTFSLDARM